MPSGDDLVGAFAIAYLRQAMRMSYRTLRERQPPPLASVGYGAAGIGYMFLRAWRASGRPAHLAAAKRWSSAAWRARTQPDACHGDRVRARAGSILFGEAGLALVDILVARAEPSRRRIAEARLQRFLTLCSPRRDTPPDFIQGMAGQLHAVATLHADRGDPRLHKLGDRLADRLLGWDVREPSFATGGIGTLAALVRWSSVSGLELPPALFRSLDTIADTPIAPLSTEMRRSWCNGSAGLALLMTIAYERTGTARYLAVARAHAREAAASDLAAGSLCCGLTGRAHALLAVDRIDPDGPWRRRAHELAALAAERARSEHPKGLFRGNPGLVCLAIDLLEQLPPRFPLVEG
jgi:hypothetical protein